MKHLFFTGPVGAGKSTALRRLLKETGWRCGGFSTVWSGDTLHLLPYGANQSACAAENRVAMRTGRCCQADPAAFDRLGPVLLRQTGVDCMVLDELGFLEGSSPAFQAAVLALLRGNVPVLGVIKPRPTPFLDAVRACPGVVVAEVTGENRDALPQIWMGELLWERCITGSRT